MAASEEDKRLLQKAFGLEDTSEIQAVPRSASEVAPINPYGSPGSLDALTPQSGTGRSRGRSNFVPAGHLFNPSAFQELSSVQGQRSGKVEAMLLEFNPDGDGEQQKLWTFLLNPSVLQFQTGASYSEQVTLAARVPGQQYGHSKGLTLQIPAIRFNTFSVGRSLKSSRDALIELTKCKIEQLQYNPPLLSFVFGATRLAPCVITEIQINEAAWLGDGEPADMSVGLTLLEVPHPEIIEQARDVIERQFGVLEGELLAEPLTERQVEEGNTEADNWLNANIAEITEANEDIATTINAGDYEIRIDPDSGRATLFAATGAELGEIGRWNGETFDSSESDLVPSSNEEAEDDKESSENETPPDTESEGVSDNEEDSGSNGDN